MLEPNTSSNAHRDNEYYNSRDDGLGYLNFARIVEPEYGGDESLAVNIAKCRGKISKPKYTYYQTYVVGEKAIEFVRANMDLINDKRANHKVLVRFVVGDSYPDSYLKKDSETGKQIRRHVIKGRLTQINWASIDGEVVLVERKPVINAAVRPSDTADTTEVLTETTEPDRPKERHDVIKLNKDDPDYISKMTRLVQKGYNYDKILDSWSIAM